MPSRVSYEHHGILGEGPSEVQVTVICDHDGLALQDWFAAVRGGLRRRAVVLLALVTVVLASAVGAAIVWNSGGVAAEDSGSPVADGGAVPAAAQSVNPVRCLSPAIALHDPRFSHSAFDASVCRRYSGTATGGLSLACSAFCHAAGYALVKRASSQ